MEQPLARLRTAHQWEQRAANKVRTSQWGWRGRTLVVHQLIIRCEHAHYLQGFLLLEWIVINSREGREGILHHLAVSELVSSVWLGESGFSSDFQNHPISSLCVENCDSLTRDSLDPHSGRSAAVMTYQPCFYRLGKFQGYWAKYDHVRLGRARNSNDVEVSRGGVGETSTENSGSGKRLRELGRFIFRFWKDPKPLEEPDWNSRNNSYFNLFSWNFKPFAIESFRIF